jgi:hypothetical protein
VADKALTDPDKDKPPQSAGSAELNTPQHYCNVFAKSVGSP